MIKEYIATYKKEVIQLLKLNTPKYFDPSEENEFRNYLDSKLEDYFIVFENDTIIGCGGINYHIENKEAILSWDMIHPDHHGKKLGTLLTKHRLDHIKKNTIAESVLVRTSQFTYKFYEKMGFATIETKKDFWAKGYHLYTMKLKH